MHRRRRRLHRHHQYYPANCCTQSFRHIRYRSLLVHADHTTNPDRSKSQSRYFEVHYCVHYDDSGQIEVRLLKNARKRCTTSQKRERKHWETFPSHHHHYHQLLLENFFDRLCAKSSNNQTVSIKKLNCEAHDETTVVNDDYYDNVVLRTCEREFRVISSVRPKCVNFHKQIFNHNIEMETLRDSKSLKEMNYDYVNCAMETKRSRQCQKTDSISSQNNDISGFMFTNTKIGKSTSRTSEPTGDRHLQFKAFRFKTIRLLRQQPQVWHSAGICPSASSIYKYASKDSKHKIPIPLMRRGGHQQVPDKRKMICDMFTLTSIMLCTVVLDAQGGLAPINQMNCVFDVYGIISSCFHPLNMIFVCMYGDENANDVKVEFDFC
ncbi:hypothetical protein GQX74_002169 [Glossina fuscipes]|nr:hypothetical protein GQX74_002169 [Glossina fuscipes]